MIKRQETISKNSGGVVYVRHSTFGRRGMGVSRRGRDLFDIDSFLTTFSMTASFRILWRQSDKVDIRK